jgi:cytochrome c-type biogenesis protein CcmE
MSGALLTPRRKRLLLILAAAALLLAAGAFVKQAFRSNLVFYVTPNELKPNDPRAKETLRVGGLVQPGSLQRSATEVRFALVDGDGRVPVILHKPVLPDLFAEGKGAIATGKLDASGTLIATEVLAKHDENYTPPNVQHPGQPGGHPGQLPQGSAS